MYWDGEAVGLNSRILDFWGPSLLRLALTLEIRTFRL